jgi:hypothetical protein
MKRKNKKMKKKENEIMENSKKEYMKRWIERIRRHEDIEPYKRSNSLKIEN